MKELKLPGSKSITNRDLILASLCDGESILDGCLLSDDTHYMMKALKNIGIEIKKDGEKITVIGGINRLRGENKELFLGNSGTSIRFLTSFCILNKIGNITLTGVERMQKRPILDLVDGIKQMGINIESNNGYPPVTISPSNIINNKVKINGSNSSQYFTSLLQIASVLEDGLEIEVIGDLVSKPYIDITVNELKKFGVNVENYNYQNFIVKPQKYIPLNLIVEGDASALSYIAAYICLHGGEIKILNIGKDTRQGDYKLLDKLKIFGLEYESDGNSTILKVGIPLVDTQSNQNNEFDFEDMPDVSLTFMILAIFLPGNKKITGLQTLNLKECKRIDAMGEMIKKLGVNVKYDDKSIQIGELKHFPKNKIDIETFDDHRIAMSFGILNSYIGNLNILDPDCVNKTYPNFWKDLEYLNKK